MGIFGTSSDKGGATLLSFAMQTGRPIKPHTIDLEKDLPKPWGARSKAAVVIAVRSGKLRRVEAYTRYMLSDEELSRWEEAFERDGIAGLQATRRWTETDENSRTRGNAQ
jgi:hypothetical protein